MFAAPAAMGIPVVEVATEPWMLERGPAAVAEVCAPLVDPGAPSTALKTATASQSAAVEALHGPLSGTAARCIATLHDVDG